MSHEDFMAYGVNNLFLDEDTKQMMIKETCSSEHQHKKLRTLKNLFTQLRTFKIVLIVQNAVVMLPRDFTITNHFFLCFRLTMRKTSIETEIASFRTTQK